MAKRLKMGVPTGLIEAVSIDYDDCCEGESRYTSPASPTNLRYARSHADLAGRNSPPLSAGVCFTEKLETDDYWNWD